MKLVKRGDWNFPIVFARANVVDDIAKQVRPYLVAMYRRLEQLGGISLAAQQVGILYSFFIWHDYQHGTKFFSVVVNPRIDFSTTARADVREADLCDPGRVVTISRPLGIKVTYQNAVGDETKERFFTDLHAQVFLHEVERQNGVSPFAKVVREDPPCTTPVKESISKSRST